MSVFLVTWVLDLVFEQSGPLWIRNVALLVLTSSALGLLLLGQSGSTPILLVLLATAVAVRFGTWATALSLVVINAAFGAILILGWTYPWNWAVVMVAAHAALQAFAVLTLRYAHQAEERAGELDRVNAHLLATRALLGEAARDQERLRLSRELHDVAGHKLTALRLNLRALSRRAELAECRELGVASELAGELLEDLRAVVRQLRQDDGIDLAEGIEQLARPFPRPKLEVMLDADARIPRTEQAEALLRVIQESLTNAARHGSASRAWLHLKRSDDVLMLEFEDDGQLAWPIRPGNGLAGMRERLEALGGSLLIKPSERGGLFLRATLPLGWLP